MSRRLLEVSDSLCFSLMGMSLFHYSGDGYILPPGLGCSEIPAVQVIVIYSVTDYVLMSHNVNFIDAIGGIVEAPILAITHSMKEFSNISTPSPPPH